METVQDMFRKTREEWLEDARATARKLLKFRNSITIEDVLVACPRPTFIHPNTTGKVFNKEFKSVGITYSKRRSSHGRLIRRWQLNA